MKRIPLLPVIVIAALLAGTLGGCMSGGTGSGDADQEAAVAEASAGGSMDPAHDPYDLHDPYDSGGPIIPEQAAYDVQRYDLSLFVNPADRTIDGTLRAQALVGSPLEWFVLDLDPVFEVTSIMDRTGERLDWEARGGRLWIDLPVTAQAGELVDVTVAYNGTPRIAPRPPWGGGFQWETTPAGNDWIATSCQQEGADIWWPVKDHVSDEPETMGLRIRVPDPLVVASNGRLEEVESMGDGTSTYHWEIHNPINAYDVALNIAPYRRIEDTYTSVNGQSFPLELFVLPADYEKGLGLFEDIKAQMAFFEQVMGPYPFRTDKYAAAQTPHLGMEHQTIIAYGAEFDNTSLSGGVDFGFDTLHQHEMSHEWWGNLITNVNWNDMWLHEGFGEYMQPLFAQYLGGDEAYRQYMAQGRRSITNDMPVAPREILSSKGIYGGDIYYKGEWILHSLRYLMGDEDFFPMLRRWAYPDPAMESATDGSQTRFATTDDFLRHAERYAGMRLDWFFDVYLRQAALPEVEMTRDGDEITLRWNVPGDLPFPMPVPVRIGTELRRIEVPTGETVFDVPSGAEVELDPMNTILRVGNSVE